MMSDLGSKKRKVDQEEGKTSPSEQEVKSWLGGMSREEAIEFIAQLSVKHPAVLNDVQERVRLDPNFTKLFVRSLSWDSTDESLKKAFEEYGEIKECVVVKDHMTHKSKGFGFVTFQDVEGVQKALQNSTKIIDGRETYCHLASEKFERAKQKAVQFTPYTVLPSRVPPPSPPNVDLTGINLAETKLFVHGLAWETTSATLRNVFEQYGTVAECAVIYDKITAKSKGYGFVTFYSPENAQAALRDTTKTIDGRQTYCHLASERSRGSLTGPKPKFISSSSLQATAPVAALPTSQTQAIQQQILQLQQQQFQLQQHVPQLHAMPPQAYQPPYPGPLPVDNRFPNRPNGGTPGRPGMH